MHRLALILGLGALVAPAAFAVPAQVGSWASGCQTGQVTGALHGGGYACYTPAAGANTESASPILNVSDCENIDVILYDDFDGDGTACATTWMVEECPPGAGALATDALKNGACEPVDGAAALDGAGGVADAESDLAANNVRLVGQGGIDAEIGSCRLIVKCAEGAQ